MALPGATPCPVIVIVLPVNTHGELAILGVSGLTNRATRTILRTKTNPRLPIQWVSWSRGAIKAVQPCRIVVKIMPRSISGGGLEVVVDDERVEAGDDGGLWRGAATATGLIIPYPVSQQPRSRSIANPARLKNHRDFITPIVHRSSDAMGLHSVSVVCISIRRIPPQSPEVKGIHLRAYVSRYIELMTSCVTTPMCIVLRLPSSWVFHDVGLCSTSHRQTVVAGIG